MNRILQALKKNYSYFLVDTQKRSIDHCGITDAYNNGELIDEDENIHIYILTGSPFVIIKSKDFESVEQVRDAFSLDYDLCLISKKEAKRILKAIKSIYKMMGFTKIPSVLTSDAYFHILAHYTLYATPHYPHP